MARSSRYALWPPASRPQTCGEAEVRSYRWICFIAAVLIPAFGIVYRLTEPTAIDPFWERGLMTLAPVSLGVASYGNAWVRGHMGTLLRGLLYVIVLWIVVLTAVNHFLPSYALGLLFTVSACASAFSTHLRSLRPLGGYLGFSVTAACLPLLWIPARANALIFISGVAGFACVFYVTAFFTVQAQRQSIENKQRYHTLMDAANDAIFVADADSGYLVNANQKAQQLVGRSLKEIRQMHQGDLYPEEERREGIARVRFEEPIGDKQAVSKKGHVVGKDGGRTPVEVSANLIEINDQRLIVSIFRDVTARRRYEEKLIEAREHAEEMLQVKSTILNNMSHEIRTPLTGILGFAEVLSENTTGDNQEFAGMIAQNARRLQMTLNSVLDMARLERGELAVEVDEVNVLTEAQQAVSFHQRAAQQKGIALSVQGAPARTQLDAACLHRILNNLVGNALKFTDEGRVTVTVEQENERVRVRVRDTGVGIDEDFLPHLFDEFQQQSNGLTRDHEGSGLGLAITKRLVNLMDGTISVESEEGVGATFTVSFPSKSKIPNAV